MTLERLFLDTLVVIDQVVQFVGRRHHLAPDEVEELQSAIRLKVIDNDYDVLRKFEGRSSMRTYLTAIVQRHFLDTRIARWGRWRPCVQARRAGPAGLLLDQLLTRDGVALDEAVAKVRARFGTPEADLLTLADQLPARTTRRFVGEEHLADMAAEPVPLEAGIVEDEARQAEQALAAALAAIDEEDRVLLKFRFVQGLQVSQIARLTGLEQKPLYRRLEAVMRVLRRELEGRGVTREQVAALVGSPGTEIGGTIQWPDPGKPSERPSLR